MNARQDRLTQGAPLRLALLGGLLLLLAPAAVRAQAGCAVEAPPTHILFGAYDPTNSTVPVTGSSTFVVDCKPKTTLVTISLDAGGGGSFNPRAMLQGSWRLEYNLYADAAMKRWNVRSKRFCDSLGSSSCTSGCLPITSSISGTSCAITLPFTPTAVRISCLAP